MCLWFEAALEQQKATLSPEAFEVVCQKVQQASNRFWGEMFAGWSDQDWQDAERAVSMTDEEYAAFAKEKGWE